MTRTAVNLIVGQPFNPYGQFRGVFIPLGLLGYRGLSDGAKLLYGRLCLFAGKAGDCFADRESLAKEMGSSVATVGRQIEELVRKGFIRRVRRGSGLAAKCEFLWHAALESSQRGKSDSAEVSHQDSAEVSHQERVRQRKSEPSDSSEVRCLIKEEKIPLKDSLTPEGISDTVSRKGGMKSLTPIEAKIATVAGEIHERHPPVRRCGPGEVRRKLQNIVRSVRAPDRMSLLDTINENHRLWCGDHEWTKDGGQFAKGLDNWLAPSMDRYLTRPAKPVAIPSQSQIPYAEDYIRRIQAE